MQNWTIQTVADALGVAPSGTDPSARIQGFSIDSRTLQPGQCFVALQGPNFDGHDFTRQALDRDAAACIVSDARCPGYPSEMQDRLIAVPDTLAALHRLARTARREWGRPVIGVTGSAGKTTIKEMLAAILSTKLRVMKSKGNLNNEYGLPLSLLRLPEEHAEYEIAVLEMGMSRPGEIARLCQVAEPDMGVVIGVAAVHLEFFDSIDEIAAAKRELVEGLTESGVAVLNADDARVAAFAEVFKGEVVWFGFGNGAGCKAENITDNGLAGTEFDLVLGGDRVRVKLKLPGRQNIQNALAACAAASRYGIGTARMGEALGAFGPAEMRGEVIRFEDGPTVVNDAYNSNPEALKAMTAALSRTPGAERRVLVAGEMRELGSSSAELHREAGEFVASQGNIDFLAGVTGDARHIVKGARDGGMDEARARFFEEKPAAADWLCDTVKAGDWVLLKASRGVELESMLTALKDRFRLEASAGHAGQAGHAGLGAE